MGWKERGVGHGTTLLHRVVSLDVVSSLSFPPASSHIANILFSYFLCYEDIPNPAKEANKFSLDVGGELVRKWSIGLWRHSEPQTTTDDIINW